MTPAEKSREALRRYRESVDIEDATADDEITETNLVRLPAPPNLPRIDPSQEGFTKLKTLIFTGGMALGTGIVAAIIQHCSH